jgi:branched-chain amino acid transport system ATP-binding protein
MLELDALAGGYGTTKILHGVSLHAPGGQVTALLGANGAGKTTLMKTLSGMVPVQSGRIRFQGEDITQLSSDKRVLAGLVLVPEGRMVFPGLSVRENLRLGAINPRARPHTAQSMEQVFVLFPRLLEREAQPAATLSGGEQQMLAIGRGLMAKPSLILLDEPSLGLSPLMAKEIFRLIGRLVADGITLLLAEQNVQQSLECSTQAYVIENGRVAAQGRSADLAGDPRIKQAYMGL